MSHINLKSIDGSGKLIAFFMCFTPLLCFADGLQIMEDWSLNGSNTLRTSVYSADGPGAASPYSSEGDMFYDEFNLYFDKRNSRYDSMRGEITGVYNLNDDYRSTNFGLVPERMSFVRENGESEIPYRAEFGDHFAYYSYLTLQRSLKGAQFEFQPKSKAYGFSHSFVFTTGADESNWRSLTLQDNYTNGLSWLMQNEDSGLSLNVVHNYRDGSVKASTLDRNQYVISLAGEKNHSTADHDVTFEAEIAHFIGDHNGVSGSASGQDRAGNGFFAQLSGRSKNMPWDYRIRVDRYDQDFQPTGAVVTSDRRSLELHSGWLYQSGIRMRGRAQFFEDSFETTNKTSTRTYGVNFTGPLLHWYYPDVSGSLDAFIQKRDDETSSVDVFTQNFNLNLNKQLRHGWLARFGFFFQNVDDVTTSNTDNFTRQLTLSADHSINIAGFEGYFTPGFMFRTTRKGTNDSDDFNSTLAMNLNKGPHAIRMDYGGLIQNRNPSVSGADISTHTFNLDYRYTKKQHVFGLETNLFGRDTDTTDSTEAYRISAYWTYNFDRPATVVARTYDPVAARQLQQTEASASVSGLAPGLTEDNVQLALAKAEIKGGVKQGVYIVYEHPVLPDVIRRQRLALRFAAGILEKSAVIIDFDDVGNRDSVNQTFERVRQILIKQLGNPTRTIEEGNITNNFVADVNAQRLVRIVEWSTPNGTIRYGLPRRLDNQVRMEIQYASNFPQTGETLWSINEIR